ncbi:MAG: hypothetical protein FD123_4114 [Bacteroidetes bacterium]|nr:MAG: hypothetical protein FD123_4114 [Bacteroidota bacterium]
MSQEKSNGRIPGSVSNAGNAENRSGFSLKPPAQFVKDSLPEALLPGFAAATLPVFQPPVQRNSQNGTVAQLTTSIKHTVGTIPFGGTTYMVGKKMQATLDPTDWVKGSATTADNYEWMKSIRAYYPAAGVIRGHLLNHDLGGYGVPENLYPISSMANSEHSNKVEQNVKGALSQTASESGTPITYNVTVNEKGPSKAPYETADFECKWTDEDGDEFEETISSKLTVDSGWGGKDKKAQVSPSKWRHGKRRGDEDIQKEIDNDSIEIDYSGLGMTSTEQDELLTRTQESKSFTSVKDWKEAVAMLSNEIDELGNIDTGSDYFKKGKTYLKWITDEIKKIEDSAGTDKDKLEKGMVEFTNKESGRMMEVLKVLCMERIYQSEGIDSEANFTASDKGVDVMEID